MKLILQRVGPAPVLGKTDGRPWALHTEDGVCLPGQQQTILESSAGAFPEITVTFFADGKDVLVNGDV